MKNEKPPNFRQVLAYLAGISALPVMACLQHEAIPDFQIMFAYFLGVVVSLGAVAWASSIS